MVFNATFNNISAISCRVEAINITSNNNDEFLMIKK